MKDHTAVIKRTNDRSLPFTLTVNGKDYPFPNHTAAVKYARGRFVNYEIVDQTERGRK